MKKSIASACGRVRGKPSRSQVEVFRTDSSDEISLTIVSSGTSFPAFMYFSASCPTSERITSVDLLTPQVCSRKVTISLPTLLCEPLIRLVLLHGLIEQFITFGVHCRQLPEAFISHKADFMTILENDHLDCSLARRVQGDVWGDDGLVGILHLLLNAWQVTSRSRKGDPSKSLGMIYFPAYNLNLRNMINVDSHVMAGSQVELVITIKCI
ncbi:hypothetical protein E2C01_013635 [Portunus trituberculatus]|uniref:Uncharacterized protein n=1 Tax=Portunus trituberculatus TaxID=210409 RepID=A0A5B7DH63_PORTR|nr:hypothetical protein [Portunus trituberculatus]